MAFEGEGGGDAGAGGFGGAADLLGGATGGGAAAGGAADTGAGGDGGAAGGAAGGAGGEAGDGAFTAPDWFEKLSAQAGEGETSSNRDWATATGIKDLDGLVKIARDSQRAARDRAGVKLPGEGAKPEEIAAFRSAIGVPEKVDDYEVTAPTNGKFDPNRPEGPDNPKTIPLNEPLVNALRESALKHGTPKAAFAGLVSDFVQLQLDEAATEKARQDGEVAAKLKEWGAAQPEKTAHIEAAARALKLTSADLVWFRSMPGGAGRALDFVAKLGAGMAEDTLITGGKGRFGVSGAEAQAEITRLMSDADFQKKVMVPGSAERARWDRLNQAAAEAKALQENGR